MTRHLTGAAVLLALSWLAVPAAAAADSGAMAPLAPLRARLAELARKDTRLQSIGWKLTRANAEFCTAAPLAAGLLLQDAMNFREGDKVRSALGHDGPIAVGAVAAGSPAELAGLAIGDEIVMLGGAAMAAMPAVAPGNYRRLSELQDRVDTALSRTGRIVLAIRHAPGDPPQRIELRGEPACPSRFELSSAIEVGAAEGTRVIIHPDALREASEPGLAVIVAHELAHNLLRHRVRLNRAGRTAAHVRATEREADRLAVWLLANAGYEPENTAAFMRRFGRNTDPGIFGDRTHDNWKVRAGTIDAEIAALRAAPRDAGGKWDWRKRFSAAALARTFDAAP